jgi:hypothetical protein
MAGIATKLTHIFIQDVSTDEIFRIRVTDWDTDKAVKMLKSTDDYDPGTGDGWIRILRAKAYIACKRVGHAYSELPFDHNEMDKCWSGHYDIVELEDGDEVTDIGPLGSSVKSPEASSPSASGVE